MDSHSGKDELPVTQAEEPEAFEGLDLSSLEKLTRESVIVRSFQGGAPKLTPPPAPRTDTPKSDL